MSPLGSSTITVMGGSPWVGIDDKLAAEQAVAHLLRIGHRNIAMIQAVDPEGVAWEGDKARVAGFHAQLDLAGIGDPAVGPSVPIPNSTTVSMVGNS